MNITIDVPVKSELDTSTTLETAKCFTIDSDAMLEIAGEELKAIKAKAKELEERRKAITVPMDNAKKKVMDLFREPLAMLEQAEGILKKAILAYQQEQRRLAEEASRIAEEAAALERKRVQEEAMAAAKAGDAEGAAEMLMAAEMSVATPVAAQQKVDGISTRTIWSAEVTDKVAYIQYALAHPELLDTIVVDMKPLNKMAGALKEKLNIPGIKPVATETISARAA